MIAHPPSKRVGQVFLIEEGNDVKPYICVTCGSRSFRAVKVDPDSFPYKPRLFKRGGNFTILAAYDDPEAILYVIFRLSKIITDDTVERCDEFVVQCHETIELLRNAYDQVCEPEGDLTSYVVDAIGPTDYCERLIVLWDDGDTMKVAVANGEIMEIDKNAWIFGNRDSAAPALLHMLKSNPRLQNRDYLAKRLREWMSRELN